MTQKTIDNVKGMILSGKSHREVARTLHISTATIYTILTGKKYKYKNRENKVEVIGLSYSQKRELGCISKNKGTSQNRLLLTYIRNAINAEPKQNKIYED